MSGLLKRSSGCSVKPPCLTLLAVIGLGGVSCATDQPLRYPCLSREPGLSGEVMPRPDGTNLYFNGECWTARYVTPTDMPHRDPSN
jgi:hypothetical protein